MEALFATQDDRYENLGKTQANYKKSPKDRKTKAYIESRIENLEKLWEEFNASHKKIIITVKKEDKDKLIYFTKDLRDQFEEDYLMYKSKLKEDLTKFIESETPPSIRSNPSSSKAEVRLHRIELPTFSGSYDEWQTFYDMFLSLVHNNGSLDGVQKLHYLKGSLTGEPENLIKHLATTESNYTEAWKQLTRRYNNKRYNSNTILRNLFSQKSMYSESADGIKSLLDTTSSCLKALSNMGIETGSWDPIVVYLVVSRLDQESHKLWEVKVSETSVEELPAWPELIKFLESRFRTLEMTGNKFISKPHYNNNKQMVKHRSFHSIAHESQKNEEKLSCVACAGQHLLYQCKQFHKQSPEERLTLVKSKRLCFNCLAPTHSVNKCYQATSCRRCGRRHHSLLHFERNSEIMANENQHHDSARGCQPVLKKEAVVVNFAKEELITHKVLLATAMIKAKSRNGYTHVIRALLDQGSQASFVTEATVQLLGLKRVPINSQVSSLSDNHMSIKYMVVFHVQSRHSTYSIQVNAFILKTLTSLLPSNKITTSDWLDLEHIPLADPHYDSPGRINILLGAEVYGEILLEGLIKNPQGGAIAQNTLFGWILSGRVRESTKTSVNAINMHINVKEDDLLKKFWELEAEPDCIKERKLTPNEERCEELFESTTVRDQDGRYVIRLPFKRDDPECQYGQSRDTALKRFHLLEKRLSKNPKLQSEYQNVMTEYLELNHMAPIEDIQDFHNPKAVYLPHHPVIREDKETTKVRVVYDASCKGQNNVSLNDELLVGPKLQQDLRHILMRWRSHNIVIVSDIIKMYRQVRVHNEDTNFQRILWRSHPDEPIQHYRLLTLTFGTAAAPYLAVKSMQQLAQDEQKKYPIASEITKRDYYMDDLMTGCETEKEAIEIYNQMNKLMNAGGFQMQKWSSNSEKLLKHITNEGLRKDSLLLIKENDMVKVLGISWNKITDSFEYTINLPEVTNPITKRKVLSDISRLYDPIGWIAPVIIIAKLYIQKLWRSGLAWDDELGGELVNEWLEFRSDLVNLKTLTIPRWFHSTRKCDIELHAFADASRVAFAAAVYVRVIDEANDIHVKLVTSKTKVAPIEKEVSIPRLELCGALLAAKLLYEVAQVMNVPKEKLHAWSDSTVVLAWLRGLPGRWTTFVSNRVSEILRTTNYDQWGHVTTNMNPSDCASRGIKPSELSDHSLWWNGPDWLHKPMSNTTKKNFSTTEEERPIKSLTVIIQHDEDFIWTKFSNLQRMLRVISYCRRVLNMKVAKNKRSMISEIITTKEIEATLQICIKQTQELHFLQEIKQLKAQGYVAKKSTLYTLCPILDQYGIIRVSGRIDAANISIDVKHPIIMPSKSHLTTLIVADAHNKTLHGGPQVMLNYLRSRFWIVQARNRVKRFYKSCLKCLRYSKSNNSQLMGQLPEVRLRPSKPFKSSGVDYAGPINIRFSPGRGSKSYKGYICLFICMVTRAIHLEAVSDLTSQGFISAFRRFVSRRGHCQDLYSDNGTNFVGADKQLREMFNSAKSELPKEVAQIITLEGTTWHFNPPQAPNFGGLWEAGIRSTKFHLKRVIGESTLTYEELSTVLSQIEACLNSRPLTQLSDDPDDPVPLTPGHFLVGEPLINIPDEDCFNKKATGIKRWRLTQKMVNDFWKRWSQEYLVTLNQRYKWATKKSEPDVDDIVIIKDDNLPPAKWMLGRLIEKYYGRDKLARVATVRARNTLYKRPISKLCFLPKDQLD